MSDKYRDIEGARPGPAEPEWTEDSEELDRMNRIGLSLCNGELHFERCFEQEDFEAMESDLCHCKSKPDGHDVLYWIMGKLDMRPLYSKAMQRREDRIKERGNNE